MENGTFYGKAWTVLFERTGIQAADLWPEGERKKTLLNARLFQCGDGALSNILWLAGSTSSPPGGIEAWRQSDRQTLAHGVSHADADLDFKRRRYRFCWNWLLNVQGIRLCLPDGGILLESSLSCIYCHHHLIHTRL